MKLKVYSKFNLGCGLIALSSAVYIISGFSDISMHPATIIFGIAFMFALAATNFWCAFNKMGEDK
ncbi:hypothetical protein LCGC14_1751620 [marine sediment metagenome]|uniref:Uncharacterized protein n=1 Tax=marine sediment metagenome TaxID=412755 RepID=A0A0F9H3T3_9ZZZZ